jgi:ABC-type bacteriocin/lantibiotic exporter with double-glycine peptidase domain
MNRQQIIEILQDYKDILNLDKTGSGYGILEQEQRTYSEDEIPAFIQDLTEAGNKNNIIFLQNAITSEELKNYLVDQIFPILLFFKENEEWIPLTIHNITPKKKKIIKYYTENKVEVIFQYHKENKNKISGLPLEDEFLKDGQGNILIIAAFRFDSLVSDPEESNSAKQLKPVQRLMRLLTTERRDIFYVYIYGILIGLINLSLPLGVQGIIGQMAGGVEISTIYILIGLVILAVSFVGVFQVMQLYLVEMMQRRIFSKASYEFTFRIPRIQIEKLQNQYVPELINRFFDVLSIQKGLPKLLIDVSTAILQIIFGLVLLAFYHSTFVMFGLVLIVALVLIFYITGPRGLETSLETSKYKYKVVYWLEEMARTLVSFKMAGNSDLPMRKSDDTLNGYLTYRHKHFRVLITQYSMIIIFKVLVIGGLLIIGSLLVIDRQITLGQFVASELVVVLIVNSVEKIIMYMEIIYDMLTAVEKIGQVTDLPLERGGGFQVPQKLLSGGINIKIRNLHYKFDGSNNYVLRGLDLDIKAGEKVGVTGSNGSGKSTLTRILSGIYTNYEGSISFNNIPMADMNLLSLRNNIAINISAEDIFEGTILENITVGKPSANYKDALKAVEKVGLLDFIQSQPDGLNTYISSAGSNFCISVVHKIILARCISKEPHFLILNDFFTPFDENEKQHILNLVIKNAGWTLLMISNDPLVLSLCDKVVVLDKGKIQKVRMRV